MERSEPSLVPEWLRCPGNSAGRGISSHHFVSPSLHLDDSSSSNNTKNRPSRSINNKDSPRSSFLDRTSSLNSQRSSSSNGCTKHPYSSFTRSHRDRNHDKEKDKSVIRGLWDNECSDPFDGILSNKVDKNILRRSQSLLTKKAGEILPRGEIDLRNASSSNNNSANGIVSRGSNTNGIHKVAFEKDFPSLGSEEKQGGHDITRIPSPGLSTAVQSLPAGLAMIGNEKWTSALAEVPVNISISSMGHSSVQKSVATPLSGSSSAMAGLNMAEALSQAPSRARVTPQVSDKMHRIEELSIKQSRQLIPMVPSTPKALVLSSSDKLKQNKTVRIGEMAATKTVQQHSNSSLNAIQSVRGGQRSDAHKSSHGAKFLVLKPVWENGVFSTAKDVSALTNSSSGGAHGQLAVATSSPTTSSTSSNGPKLTTLESKAAAMAVNLISIREKRPSITQAQSRNDFFNLIRKKTLMNSSSSIPDSSLDVGSPVMEGSGDTNEVVSASMYKGVDIHKTPTNSVDAYEEYQGFRDVGEKDLSIDGAVFPDEEEAAFLRSLGWDENGGEDEGLTEEEINAFYQECMKLRPSFKVCESDQRKSAILLESRTSNSAGPS